MMQEKKNDPYWANFQQTDLSAPSAPAEHFQNKFLRALKKTDGYYFLLAIGMMGMFWCLHLLLGGGFAAPTFYNT